MQRYFSASKKRKEKKRKKAKYERILNRHLARVITRASYDDSDHVMFRLKR